MKTNKLQSSIITICTLIGIAVAWRVLNNRLMIAPNLELITTASLLAVVILKNKIAIIVPVLSMIISDLIIGNTAIFIYTWSAFAIIGLGALLISKLNNQPRKQIIFSVGFAIASSFTFFVVTNLGVWLQGWYPATLAGLTECFLLAIPFYKTMLIGNIILVPASIIVWQLITSRQTVKSLVVDTFISK